MKLETEIWVLDCPLLSQDGADDTRMSLPTCQDCEYHKGFTLLEVDCGYDEVIKANMRAMLHEIFEDQESPTKET